ncbi:prepilin-type N-terminal cleavage/methylation domain-containing protein [Patescibacteria group bacterium]|nr:prepilin-type N-terminal cleavage/methylation domain-containing protein [Patescibacteria group bacterium]
MAAEFYYKKSFTLIEILIAVAIIGLLASIVIVNVNSARDKAKIAKSIQFSSSIYHALGSYAVGYWDFNEIVGGTVRDISDNGNTGTLKNGPAPENSLVFSGGNLGKALRFDGSNDYVNVPFSSMLSPGADLTMEAWVNWSGGGGDKNIVTKESAYEFRVNAGNVNYATNPWAWRGGTSAKITAGSWNHIVITHDGNGLQKIYINGVEKYSTAAGGEISSNSNPVTIGARYGGTASFFNGLIDEVKIYSVVLNFAQVQQNYAKGLEEYKALVIQ